MNTRLHWWHVAFLFVGVIGGWLISSFGPAEVVRLPVIHRVTTTDTVYFGKPYAVRGPARLIYRTVAPSTVLVSVPGKLDTVVTSFCTALANDSTGADSARHRQLVLTAGTVDRRRLQLYGFRNDGSAWSSITSVRPPYRFLTVGDSVEVNQPRLRWQFPSLGTVAACGAAGAAGALGIRLLH